MPALAYATSWRDLAPPRSLQSVMRHAALSKLYSHERWFRGLASRLRQPRVQVLILHHVFPDEEKHFRALLKRLHREHEFIPYSDAVRRAEVAGNQVDKPYLAFTFDDGMKNCLRAAAILEEFGARACFFVCPAIVGERSEPTIQSFCRDQLELRHPVEFMTWDDLHWLRQRGHEIGGHTMSHPHLNQLSPEHAANEVRQSREVIVKHMGDARHFAWTYGRFNDCTPQVVREVYACGYETCASAERGCHGPVRASTELPLCIRRDHIEAHWPIKHCLFFLSQASRRMSSGDNDWPANWKSVIRG